jgi:predicted MFS family arabinose efflux permease
VRTQPDFGRFPPGLAFGGVAVSSQSFTTKEAADEAESAGALMLTTIQFAICTGALLGGLLVNSIGVVYVFLFTTVMTSFAFALLGSKRWLARTLTPIPT